MKSTGFSCINMIDFNKLIENYLAREVKARKIGRYYASDVGNCLRRVWFSYKLPKQLSLKTLKIFKAGEMLHDFIVNVIRSEKNKDVELLQNEMPIQIDAGDFLIIGRVDDVVLVKTKAKKMLIELKTAKSLPEACKLEHQLQLQIYMAALGIKDGMVVYIQKDNLETVSFNVTYSEALFKHALERFKTLHHCLISNTCPEPEGKKFHWMCNGCPWRQECESIA